MRPRDAAVTRDHQHPAELCRVALRAALDDSIRRRDLGTAGDDSRVPQLVNRRDLRARGLVGLAVGVDQHLHAVQAVLLDEVLRVTRRPLADHDEPRADPVEVLPVAMQLHRVRSAEDSAVVA